MAKTKHPEATVMISGVTRELFPLLSAILPSHFEALVAPGVYTTVESAKALHTLAPFQQGSLNAHFWLTLQGDSMSVLPQLPSSSVYQSLQAMQQYGLDGYMVRYWTLGDLVPTSAYLARASWELTDPETFYRKHLDTICGREAVDEVINAFDSIDEATRFLAQRRHGKWIIYGNPMPGLLEEHYHVEKADYPELDKAIAIYRRALDHLRRASDRSTDQGKDYLEYFMARSEMAIDYPAVAADGPRIGSCLRRRSAGSPAARSVNGSQEANRGQRPGSPVGKAGSQRSNPLCSCGTGRIRPRNVAEPQQCPVPACEVPGLHHGAGSGAGIPDPWGCQRFSLT